MPTRVYYGKGNQTVYAIPRRNGRAVRVASGTYAILDTRFAEGSAEQVLVASTDVTLSSASTTISARAGRGAADHRKLTVVSSTNFVEGRTYLLEGVDGYAEEVRVAKVASATVILADNEIVGDYAASSLLRGLEVAGTFPSTAADDPDNLDGLPWIIVWTLPELPPQRDSIHLERAEEAMSATQVDLIQLDPQLGVAGGDRQELSLALARAQRDFRVDISLAGADEALVLAGPIGRDAVLYLAAYHALKGSNDESAMRRCEDYRRRYNELRANLQSGARKPEVVSMERRNDATTARNPLNLFRTF